MLSHKLIFLPAIVCLINLPNKLPAQCCSAGLPSGVGTYAGMVSKKTLRITTFGRFTHSKDYYRGDIKLDRPILVKQSNFLFQGISVSYGILKGVAVDLEAGYFYIKDQTLINDYYQKGYGFSNGILMLKTNIFKSDSLGIELSIGGGLKFPFSKEALYVNHVRLNSDLQPSTNAFGYAGQLFFRKRIAGQRMNLYVINRYEYNVKNTYQYRFGSRFRSSVIWEYSILRNFGIMMQARYELSTHDYDYRINKQFENSGSSVFFLSPLIFYSIASTWHISGTVDIPVYRVHNGTQLSNNYSLALNLTKDIPLAKRAK
jgi:hypothetical protein